MQVLWTGTKIVWNLQKVMQDTLSVLSTLILSLIKMKYIFFEFLRKALCGSSIFIHHCLELKVCRSLWWTNFQKLELLETTKKVYLNWDWITDFQWLADYYSILMIEEWHNIFIDLCSSAHASAWASMTFAGNDFR